MVLNCGRWAGLDDEPGFSGGSRPFKGDGRTRRIGLVMVELADRQAVGPYLLMRALEPMGLAERYLALHGSDQSSHVAYRFPARPGREDLLRFVEAVRVAEGLRHEHILPIEFHTIDAEGRPWLVSPFTGDVDGVRTLTKLLREKQGQMHPFEVERALVHLLEASNWAHKAQRPAEGREGRLPIVHGPLSMDQILVDRHGRLVIELYGFARLLAGEPMGGDAELVRDEVRSIVEIGYQLITGLRAETPMIPAGRLVKRLDSRWDRWLLRGLDAAGGFDTAGEALAQLPSRAPAELEEELVAGVRGVLGRLRPGRW